MHLYRREQARKASVHGALHSRDSPRRQGSVHAGLVRELCHPPRSSRILPAVIHDQKIQDLYLHHVGTVANRRAAGTEAAPFVHLELCCTETGEPVYATLGASAGPLQHEIFLGSHESSPGCAEAVEAVVRAAPALTVGAVIPHAIPGTQFTALLVLPLDDKEGSFALGKAGAPPYAFQLAALTAAEQALAEREPDRVVALLRYAYAFSVNRHRACLVDLPSPPPAARTEIALDRRQKRAAVLALQAKVLGEHDARGGTSGRPMSTRLYRGHHVGLISFSEGLIEGALRPYLRHPAPVVHLFAEFLYVTLATHPDAVCMIDHALDPRNLPQPHGGDPGQHAVAASRRTIEGMAIAIARLHPGESEAALVARGAQAALDARETLDPADEIPLENHVWAAALPAMYEGLEDLKLPAVRGMPKVFRRAAENEKMLEYELDPRPPLVRIMDIAPRLATQLVLAYAAGLRQQL